jgi:hypothetical protein
MIEITEGAAGLGPNRSTNRLDANAFHLPKIQDETIIASSETRHAMPAATNR